MQWLDIENQSGKYSDKTRISKKGNNRIRRCLYMSAFGVVKYKQTVFSSLFERTLAKYGIKMKSYVAVQKTTHDQLCIMEEK